MKSSDTNVKVYPIRYENTSIVYIPVSFPKESWRGINPRKQKYLKK